MDSKSHFWFKAKAFEKVNFEHFLQLSKIASNFTVENFTRNNTLTLHQK
jgi:hypothetical protein